MININIKQCFCQPILKSGYIHTNVQSMVAAAIVSVSSSVAGNDGCGAIIICSEEKVVFAAYIYTKPSPIG